MDKGDTPQPPNKPVKKTGFRGKPPKRKFSGNLKAGSNKKNSKTRRSFDAAVDAGEDVAPIARSLPTGARSAVAARKPTKAELQCSLRLTNEYADRIEGERDELQKQADKNKKRGDNWKATAEAARADKKVSVGALKSAEEERDALAYKLEEEVTTKSMEIALATSETKVRNSALLVHPCVVVCLFAAASDCH